ncbi:MAG: hypothetical protein Q8T09_10265 [Candidatus Melainabacteria bacterium]|nr:hypothetical protein [Candidatus Melainabacteria bacterium]
MSTSDHDQVIWNYLQNKKLFAEAKLSEALEQAVAHDDITSIYLVTGLCLHPTAEIREKAWAVIDYLLRDVTPQDLVKIDIVTRSYRIIIEQIKLLDDLTIPTNVLGLFSFNPNGFIREKALRQLANRFDGRELPFILLRANDWVESIHDQAIAALRERLEGDYSRHFTDNLYLIKHLSTLERYNHEGIQELIANVLCSPQYEPELLNYLNSERASERLFAFTLLLKIESPTSVKTAINAGLASKDALIRHRALDFALTSSNVNLIERPMASLLTDSAATVRLEALHWLAEKQDCRDILEAAFFDSSFAVRLFARYRLKEVDAKDIYTRNLQTKNYSLLFTLRGLIEIKAELPIDLIEPLTSSSRGKVRALAYELLLAQDKIADKEAIVFRALLDQSNHCTKSAHKYLEANADSVAIESIWELFNQELPLAAKLTLLSAIADSPPWISLPYLLAAKVKIQAKFESAIEAHLDKAIDCALEHWLDKTVHNFTNPSPSSLNKLQSSLEEAKSVLKPKQYQSIKAVLNRH